MAGIYADAPGNRMAYDKDLTVVSYYHTRNGGQSLNGDSVPAVDLSLLQKQRLNTEQTLFAPNLALPAHDDPAASRYIAWKFPENREVDGIFSALLTDTFNTSAAEFQYSTNSKGGRDGTWVTDTANVADYYDNVYGNFRDEITSTAINNVGAVRQRYNAPQAGLSDAQGVFHIYGTIAPSVTPDRLIFLDSENSDSAFVKVLDYGDIPKGQTSVRTIKVINNSTSKTFSGVSLVATDLYLNAATWYDFAENNVDFETPLDLGIIGPGVSKTLYMKQTVPSGETSGVQTARLELTTDPVVT